MYKNPVVLKLNETKPQAREIKTEFKAKGVYRTLNTFPHFFILQATDGDWIFVPEEHFSNVRGRASSLKAVKSTIAELIERGSYQLPEDRVRWNT